MMDTLVDIIFTFAIICSMMFLPYLLVFCVTYPFCLIKGGSFEEAINKIDKHEVKILLTTWLLIAILIALGDKYGENENYASNTISTVKGLTTKKGAEKKIEDGATYWGVKD